MDFVDIGGASVEPRFYLLVTNLVHLRVWSWLYRSWID